MFMYIRREVLAFIAGIALTGVAAILIYGLTGTKDDPEPSQSPTVIASPQTTTIVLVVDKDDMFPPTPTAPLELESTPRAALNPEDTNADLVEAQQTKVAANPDDYEAQVLLANILGNSNRLDEAIPVYEKALLQRPDDVATRLDFARALSDGGKTADAEVQFQKIIELDPGNQAAIYYLAELYRTSTPPRIDEAVPLYQKANSIDPDSFIGEQSANQLAILGIPIGISSPMATPS
jgi:cytochrome c-type biogenesis protein CcmH/NrfG